jgi:CubicO group peptidase (beta-lactamase class C family)
VKTRTRWILFGACLAELLLLIIGIAVLVSFARIGTAYAAKIAASAVFVAGRDTEAIIADGDLDRVSGVRWEVDREGRRVTAWIGPISQTAVYRDGLGTALVIDRPEAEVRALTAPPAPGGNADDPRPWPTGDVLPEGSLPEGVDKTGLATVLDEAFADPNPTQQRRTRAVVIVQDGRLVAERYAVGFTRQTPLLGWSMTKSVTSALAGILVAQGKLRIEDPAGLPEWSKPSDPRGAITVDQLLRMSSGLRFTEEYGNPFADATFMLFGSGDAAGYAASRPLEAKPDARWQYSSGTTNIVSRVLRLAAGNDATYHALPRRALFDRIGMRHAVIETDASGTFIGSSFSWASARDWARFGLLFLNDGVWEGERILPEGWVDYCRRPTPAAPNGCYGAHWWCNAGSPDDSQHRPMPSLPTDYYAARGFQGQSVNIFPSRRIVVVRLGLTDASDAFDIEDFLAKVLRCVAR